MQFILASLIALVVSVAANPLQKRACAADTANIGFATGVTGGIGGTTTTVTTLAALTSAVTGSAKKIVYISGTITGAAVVKVGSNTSVIGKAGSLLAGIGLRVLDESNVIIRNVKVQKVLATYGDAIAVQASYNVWIDHVDVSSDLDHDKDYYDGLIDLTHGIYGVTVSWSKLSTHWKASLIGHSDDNGAEDVAIRVTLANNYWTDLNSRTPSFRFGQGHVFNNYYYLNQDGINVRDSAQLLIQNNVWESCKNTVYQTDTGYATLSGNIYGNATVPAVNGTSSFTPPYSYSLIAASSVKATITASAGATLGC